MCKYGTEKETPEIDPQNSQLIIDKGAKAIQRRKDSLFNQWCWNNSTFTCKKKKKSQKLTQNKS